MTTLLTLRIRKLSNAMPNATRRRKFGLAVIGRKQTIAKSVHVFDEIDSLRLRKRTAQQVHMGPERIAIGLLFSPHGLLEFGARIDPGWMLHHDFEDTQTLARQLDRFIAARDF